METEDITGRRTEKDGSMVQGKTWIDDSLFLLIHRHMPILCVDLLVMGGSKILLCLRKYEPEAGKWYVPGGRLHKGEEIREAAIRILREEVGMEAIYLRHLGWDTTCFDTDPFGHGKGTHTVNALFHVVPSNIKWPLECDQHTDIKWMEKGVVEFSPDIPHRIRKIARMI